MSSGECLISRRNRQMRQSLSSTATSTRKRSLSPASNSHLVKNTGGTDSHTESAHREKCCKMVSTEENDLNNSDIWLAEIAMPSEAMQQLHGDLAVGKHQDELQSITTEKSCTFSRNVSDDLNRTDTAHLERKQAMRSAAVINVQNLKGENDMKRNRANTRVQNSKFVPQKLFDTKVSSPVREKSIFLCSYQEYSSALDNKELSTKHTRTDDMNFSGDADLFDDSLTEFIAKDRLQSASVSECLLTEIQGQVTNECIHPRETHKENTQDRSYGDDQNQDDDHKRCETKCNTRDNIGKLKVCDTTHFQTHDSVGNHIELLSNPTVYFPDCSDYQDTEPSTEIPTSVTPVKESDRLPSQTAQTVTPMLKVDTESETPHQPAKTSTPKAKGSCLKDRLKNRLLHNASKVTPSADTNSLEELRKEGIAKAMSEASQIRREGMVDGIGPFYGLPSKVQELLTANRKITKLYDWQDVCLRLPALYAGRNLIYTLPTSGGKTLVAEILILQQLLCKKKNALLILPYISIVQEKVRILSEFAVELGFLVEEYAGSKGRFPPMKRRQKQSLFVATIEKGQSLVNSLLEGDRLGELGLVVVDELHMIGEGGSRGSAMESCLLKLMNATKDPPQMIGMSATLNNIADLANFLNAEVFSSDFRPVSLTEYVKVEDNLYLVNNKALVPEDKLQHDKILTFSSEERQQTDPDHLLHLVMEIIPDNSCLLFCPTKRYCENVALMLAKMMSKQHRHLADIIEKEKRRALVRDLHRDGGGKVCPSLRYTPHWGLACHHRGLTTHANSFTSHLHLAEEQKDKRRALLRELHSDGGGKVCPTLRYTLHFGIAYHHSGLTTDERRLIEDAYSDGVLCLLTCTSTLAAGVNLPAQRVILRSPYVGADFIKHSQYKQMTGRAGRAGIDSSGESILITKKADMPKVVELLSGPQDVCHSSLMYQSGKGLRSLILSLIGLKVVETTQLVYAVMQKALLTIQAAQLDVDVVTATRQTLQQLIDAGLVVQKKTQDAEGDLLQLAEKTNAGENSALSGTSNSKGNVRVSQGGDSQDLFEATGCSKSKRMRTEDAELLSRVEALRQPQGLSSTGDVCCNVGDSPSDYRLEVTELGRATFKSSVDLEYGSRLYEDLQQGKQSLVLSSHLHLLYLVTPYDLAKDVSPCWMTYLHQLGTLAPDDLKVSSLIGIPESFIVRKASGRSSRQKVDLLVVQRFYLTLMLHELWQQFTVWEVAERFQKTRGFVQSLLSSAASFASCVLRFCQELPELWAYQDLLVSFGQRLTYCVTMELLPLMEVPGVKLGRARQLYAAGYQTLQSLASAEPGQLVSKIQFLTRKAARQIVSAAKVVVEEKRDALLEQVEELVPLPQASTPLPAQGTTGTATEP